MGLVIEGFVIENLIKEGGFGGVYKVKRVLDKKIFAIKILTPKAAADSGIRGQFAKEVKLLASFNHPNIVKVHETIPVAPRPAMLMEYFESETLHTLILNKSPLIQEKGIGIFRQISYALDYLHERKIIHKDLKPENILVSKDGEARLIDFSIAEKVGLSSFFRRRRREGTPLYMSPEQIKRRRLDVRTDIYSLGASFYHAYLGTPHISADSEKALLQKQLKAPIPKMRQINKQIPYQIDSIISRMLRKLPQERYQSIKEMLFDLKRFTNDDHLLKTGAQEDEAEGE